MLFDDSVLAEKYPTLNKFTNFVKEPEREIIGRKDEMRAIWASMMRPELCNVILIGEAGSGKALSDDTLIPVADDRVHTFISNLKVGDTVFDENGQPTRVLGVFPQGKLDAYRVRFSDGTDIICNDEHLWAARETKSRKKQYKIYTLRQMLNEGISYTSANGEVRYNWHIPVNKAVERTESMDFVDFYAAGVYMSNGCNVNGLLALDNVSEAVAHRFAKAINAEIIEPDDDLLYKFFRRGEQNSPRYVRTEDVFSDLNPDFKHVSDRYLNSSVFQRYEFLRGMMDAGGYITDDDELNCSYVTKDKNLVETFGILVNSLGIRYSFSSSDVLPEYAFQLLVPDVMKSNLFWREDRHKIINRRVTGRKIKQDYNSELAVIEVEKLEEQKSMTCIYVSSPSHLFQAGINHIVTHNTMLVQGTMMKDNTRSYLEVNLSNMISTNGSEALPGTLETLFSEVMRYRQDEGKEIVLFIDEFHRIIQESPPAVEALKPLLADSGTRGIKIIAATTYIEFQKWISPNQPLVERLQRINITQPGKEMTMSILKGMAKRYGVDNQFYDDHIYEMIYEYTNRYIPANSQPRKSILVLDNMIGWHKAEGRRLGTKLLADVIYQQEGINVAFRVDATKIKEELDKHVLSQQFATSVIEQRLQICVADLNDKSKPMSSFLFTGPTGCGKTELSKQLTKILFEDDRRLCRFDMTEYANPDSLERFRQELTARVWAMPYCIVLLDEIEKACSPVTRLLLQVLDDGRLMDQNNREVVFTNCYVILTTNAGSEIYRNISQYNADDTGSGAFVKKYDKLIRASISGTTGDNRFPPELLGRIDCIVPFQPLSEETMKKIVEIKLKKLQSEVRQKHGVTLAIKADVIRYLVMDNLDTNSDSGGARIVMSKLESEVTTAIAKYINAHPGITKIGVRVKGNMRADNKYQLESEAYIDVVAVKS